MARCPFAIWRPLPENSTQPALYPTQFIVHTAVDAPGPTDLPGYFARPDVKAESHFWLPFEGPPVQMIDTAVQANANRKADVRAISVETEDDGDPERNPWNESQLYWLERLIRWAHEVHGIPLRLCPAWDAPGLGYHSMWGFRDPINKVGPIDNPWSLYLGKTCPGKTRTKQFLDVLLPRLQEDDDVKADERAWLQAIYEAMFHGKHGGPMAARVFEIHEQKRAVKAVVDSLDYNRLAKAMVAELLKAAAK